MINEFIWFIWALTVTVSNIILSIIVYYFLDTQAKLDSKMTMLKDITFYYSIGMMLSIIWAIMLFILII